MQPALPADPAKPGGRIEVDWGVFRESGPVLQYRIVSRSMLAETETLPGATGSIGMNTIRFLAVLALLFVATPSVQAQRGGPGGGFRGGPGGDGGGPGGFRGGPGGFRGGPGGGGFRGGGDRGRGGFDPSEMLKRLDANGNGVLDPEEQQGPAQFIIGRMQQSDPSIKPGQPISLKKISEGFEKMRAEREGRDPGQGGPRPGGSAADEALMPELLVPGFGIEEPPTPLLGFGATAEMLSVVVTDEDKREAAERMRRYDRNRDGFLTKDELSSRFSGNPMDFDRNRDGKLSESELAVRYARRREGEEEARAVRSDPRRSRTDQKPSEPPDIFNGRKSYRVVESARKLPEGLPRFFTDRDANGDGQVTMAEYASEWNESVIAEYFRSDLNGDGIITTGEAMRALEMGDTPSGATSLVGATTSSTSDSSTSSSSPSGSSTTDGASAKADAKLIAYAKRIISRYDKNKDEQLTPAEWENMLLSPAKADANGNGRVTVDEYANWMAARSAKK